MSKDSLCSTVALLLILTGCVVSTPVHTTHIPSSPPYADESVLPKIPKSLLKSKPRSDLTKAVVVPITHVRLHWTVVGAPGHTNGVPYRHLVMSKTNLIQTQWQIRTQWVQRIYPGPSNLTARVQIRAPSESFKIGIRLE